MLTGDIHEEVQSHNRLLDKMGNNMDTTRGVMSGTMDQFKKKSNRRMCTLVTSFIVGFIVLYYVIRILRYVHG
ncbi:hypothetical protein SLE2022_250550 [Rubroshorea leprosula]